MLSLLVALTTIQSKHDCMQVSITLDSLRFISYLLSNSVLLHTTFPGVFSKGTEPLLSEDKGFSSCPASLMLFLACPSHSTAISPKSFSLFFSLLM